MTHVKTPDEILLTDAVRVLEFATFHDGRYSQVESEKFQKEAIRVSQVICARLKRERYADIDAPTYQKGNR